MQSYSALTWDHPRGYRALAAAAARLDPADGVAIDWHKQSLEGFESHPIAELCARYDLVVLDHPHVGEAVEEQCLQPMEEIFGEAAIAELAAATIGPCLSSYRYAGKHWALPLDAATQVMAARADLIEEALPVTWADVERLSARSGKVALSLAGPHAFLSYLSVVTCFGEPSATLDPERLVAAEAGRAAFEVLASLASRSPDMVRDKNPIALLSHMAENDDVILCPLVYGYVNYAAPDIGRPLAFLNAPRSTAAGRPGSTLGGTGIGISKHCKVTPELRRHLLWLMGEEAQTDFIPFHDGQPSRRSAWADDKINARWGDFYRNTAATLEAACVRPRRPGYIAFQSKASALLREALGDGRAATQVVADLQILYRNNCRAGWEK